MSKDLYQEGQIVYRIYDPIADKFCCSGRGLYANNGRSVWFARSPAVNVQRDLPPEIRDRTVIKLYELREIEA